MIIAITMVKNEANIISYSIRHLKANGVDGIIMADNNSVDGTAEVAKDVSRLIGYDITIIDEPSLGYYQSAVMTKLYNLAISRGARWIIPFDADELVIASDMKISEALNLSRDKVVLGLRVYDHCPTNIDGNRDNDNPFLKWPFRKIDPQPIGKIIVQNLGPDLTILQGNHGVRLRGEPIRAYESDIMQIRHFRFYNGFESYAKSAVEKLEAYENTDLPESVGSHWRLYGRIARDYGADILAKELRKNFSVEFDKDGKINLNNGATADVIYDPAPWRG